MVVLDRRAESYFKQGKSPRVDTLLVNILITSGPGFDLTNQCRVLTGETLNIHFKVFEPKTSRTRGKEDTTKQQVKT